MKKMDIAVIISLVAALLTIDFNKEALKALVTGGVFGIWLKTKL